MIKETYNPHQAPKVGDYVKISDPTLPPDFTCKVARVAFIDEKYEGESRYLVEFIESHPRLHNGMAREAQCKNHHGWWVGLNEMAPLKVDALVMNDGDTIYVQRSDKRRITGSATCSKMDQYDPLTGAIIAFARAHGQDPTTAAYKVLQAFSKIPAPKKLRLVFHSSGNPYGELGAPTPYKDKDGVPLYVGDQVQVRDVEDTEPFDDLYVVVETPEDGPFVMGIRADCNTKTGAVKNWELEWKKSWKELAPGDEVHGGYIDVVEAPEAPAPEPEPKKKRQVFWGGPEGDRVFYGELGADTNLVDSFGTPLFVGDVVSVLHRNKGVISDDPVVCVPGGRPFVMGLAGQRFEKGRRNPDWRIVKARPYTDLLIGEKFSDGWLEVKEEEIAPEKKLVLRWAFGERKSLGKAGDPTPLIDRDGEKLCIGDLVECFHNGAPLSGIEPIVLFKECGPESNGGYYAMGLASIDFAAPGEHEGYSIKKVKSYTELTTGELLSSGVVEVKEVKIDG